MFTLTFRNLSFLVTQLRKCLLCRYSANTYRMYYRHQSHHKTGDLSCSRQLLENLAFERPIIDKVRFASYQFTFKRYYTDGHHHKTSYFSSSGYFSQKSSFPVTHKGKIHFPFDAPKT